MGIAICLALAGVFGVGCERPAPEATTASSPASSKDTLLPGVMFSADPNPVPPGNAKGRTTITWDTGSDAVGEVFVVSGGNEKLFGSGRTGSQDAPWIAPGSTEFRLYDQSDRKLLGKLIVTMLGPDSNASKTSAATSP